MNEYKEKNFVIAGVGGQGNILASKVVAEAARIEGIKAIVGEVYGESQRGGSVASHVRLGSAVLSPLSPEQGADLICGLEPMETLRVARVYGSADGVIVVNTRPHYPVGVTMGRAEYPPISRIIEALKELAEKVVAFDATAIAEQAGAAMLSNVVMIGAVSTHEPMGISRISYEKAIRQSVPKNVEQNLQAFSSGRAHHGV